MKRVKHGDSHRNVCKQLGGLLGLSLSFQMFLICESTSLSVKYLRPVLAFMFDLRKEQHYFESLGPLISIEREYK